MISLVNKTLDVGGDTATLNNGVWQSSDPYLANLLNIRAEQIGLTDDADLFNDAEKYLGLRESTKPCPLCGSNRTSWVRSLQGNLQCGDCGEISTIKREDLDGTAGIYSGMVGPINFSRKDPYNLSGSFNLFNQNHDEKGKFAEGDGSGNREDIEDSLKDNLDEIGFDRGDVQRIASLKSIDKIHRLTTESKSVEIVPIGSISGLDKVEDSPEIDSPKDVPPAIVGPDGDLIDGNHRISGLLSGGSKTVRVIRATQADMDAAKDFGGLQGKGSWPEETWIKWMLLRAEQSNLSRNSGKKKDPYNLYRADQPRDEKGRFAGGGGTPVNTAHPRLAPLTRQIKRLEYARRQKISTSSEHKDLSKKLDDLRNQRRAEFKKIAIEEHQAHQSALRAKEYAKHGPVNDPGKHLNPVDRLLVGDPNAEASHIKYMPNTSGIRREDPGNQLPATHPIMGFDPGADVPVTASAKSPTYTREELQMRAQSDHYAAQDHAAQAAAHSVKASKPGLLKRIAGKIVDPFRR